MVRCMANWFVGLSLLLLCTCCATRVEVHTVEKLSPPEDAGTPALETDAGLDIPLRTPDEAVKTTPDTPMGSPFVKAKEISPEIITPAPYAQEDLELARRIVRWKKKIDRNIWRECGKKYTVEEIPNAALEWACAINTAYNNTTYKLRSGVVRRVNKKEAIGIMIHESRFDRCAVGPHPRKFAYKHKLLKRPGGSTSHSLEELEAVFTHPKFQGKLADIGPGQIVKKIGSKHHTWEETKKYLTISPGVQKVFTEMARRGTMYNTKTPSSHWPGSKRHLWYTIKVLRFAAYLFADRYYKNKT